MSDLSKGLIEKAKNKFPLPVYYKGKLSEQEMEEIRSFCRINAQSVYMSGNCSYIIRFDKRNTSDNG